MPEKRAKKNTAPKGQPSAKAPPDDGMPRPVGMTSSSMPAPTMSGAAGAAYAPSGAAALPGAAAPPVPQMVSEAADTMPRPKVPTPPSEPTTMPNPASPKVAAAMPVPNQPA